MRSAHSGLIDRIGTYEEFVAERFPNHQWDEVKIGARHGWSAYDAFFSAASDIGSLPGSIEALTGLLDPTLSAARVDAAIEAVLGRLSPEQLSSLLADLAEATLEASYKHLRNSSV